MKRALIIVAVLVICCGPTLEAQRAVLSPQQIDDAIKVGLKAKGRGQGLFLTDTNALFASALAGALSPGGSSVAHFGFSAEIYTPTTWIRQQASGAAKLFLPFTSNDVDEEILEPVLRVFVHPDTPAHVTSMNAASVEHAVIRDQKRMMAIQPLSKEEIPQTYSNFMGGTMALQGLLIKFPLDAVRELRGAKQDGIILTVIGEGGRQKDFVIQKDRFTRLP